MYTSTSSSFVSISKKAIFAGLISATVAGATLIGAASPALASTRGWIHEGNTWSYQVSKDTYAKGWYHAPNGKWFYFNKDNYKMVTGKLTDDHKDYWLDENAGLLYDAWVQDAKGNWLHTDDNGVLATGWFKTKSGYWFYFNQDHTMKTGILTDKGYTFWLDKNDGLLYNEWVKDESGKWLRTDGNGCLVKGWYHAPNGKWFYFNKDNYKMVTGKLTDDNKDYWLDENAGLLYDAWVQDAKGNWLHTDDNGVLATGWFKTKSGYWFYFNQDHTMKTGILTDKGYTFWLDKNDGLLYNEWVKDESGKWLRTDGNGCLVKGWYHAPNGKWFYFNKDNYKMVTGKLTDDHKDYWLDENAGLLYDSWVQDAKGNWLHTDENGCLVKGWYQTLYNEKWWYFNDDYKLATGKVTDKGFDYWVDASQGVVYDSWVQDAQGNWLYADKWSFLVKGWYHAPNGKWFYFNDDYTLRTDPLVEKGKRYYFDINMGLIRTEPLTQGSESANKPSSSSTGRVLDTDKNHKPFGATRWVVDKPAWTETKYTVTTKYTNGHIVSVSTTDPNDLAHIEDTDAMQAWREGKYPGIKTEEEARKEFWTTKLARLKAAENCKYLSTHEFKPGEAGTWTELPLKTETIEHPEQGHWE